MVRAPGRTSNGRDALTRAPPPGASDICPVRARPPAPSRAAVDHGGVHTSGESGFSLIEVLVSALLVALVATGVLAGTAGPAHAGGDRRPRATGASLAQQELERLRALNPATLSG